MSSYDNRVIVNSIQDNEPAMHMNKCRRLGEQSRENEIYNQSSAWAVKTNIMCR